MCWSSKKKMLWWFLRRLLGLLSQGIWLDMKECSALLWAWLLEGGRGKDPVFFLCIFQLYYAVGLVHITHLSPVISRLVSILKEQEDEGLHQQEIYQCTGKGCCLFLNGLGKCWEALLFEVSYIIQGSSLYVSSWSREAAKFLNSSCWVNPLVFHLLLEMQLS